MVNCQIRDKPSHLAAMFFDKSNILSYFGRRSPSDSFWQIIFNSDHKFQRRRHYGCIRETGHAPGGHGFRRRIKLV